MALLLVMAAPWPMPQCTRPALAQQAPQQAQPPAQNQSGTLPPVPQLAAPEDSAAGVVPATPQDNPTANIPRTAAPPTPKAAKTDTYPESRGKKTLTMTLPEAVMLTLRDSVVIQSAYLDRVTQKFDLDVSEQIFLPKIGVDGSLTYSKQTDRTFNDGASSTSTTTETTSTSATLSMDEKIPTGAEFSFSWNNSTTNVNSRGQGIDGSYTPEDTWSASVTQPLLKGFGIDVNMADLELARLEEQQNINNLKSTLIGQVTATIQAYRSYLTALKLITISENALKRSNEQLERNRLLIQAGRMAGFEILQSESDVANREVDLENTRINVDTALKTLLSQLNLDLNTTIQPVEETTIPDPTLELDNLLKIAFAHRPDWLNSLLSTKTNEIYLLQAENNRLWQLDLKGSYSYNDSRPRKEDDTDTNTWGAGLEFSAPIWGQDETTREQLVPRAQIALRKQTIAQERLREDIEIEIQNAVEEVRRKKKRMELARRARELSEKTLAAEQERLNFGRSTNFKVVSFQNDLIQAQNNELAAVIDYLNALTSLDQSLGTTLGTWKIDFKTQNDTYQREYRP